MLSIYSRAPWGNPSHFFQKHESAAKLSYDWDSCLIFADTDGLYLAYTNKALRGEGSNGDFVGFWQSKVAQGDKSQGQADGI